MPHPSRGNAQTVFVRRAAALAVVVFSGWVTVSCGTQRAPAAVPVTTVHTAPTVAMPTHTVPVRSVPTQPVRARPARSGARQPSIVRYVAVAERVYDAETGGVPVHRELRHVVDDPTVLGLLRSGRDTAMRRYVTSRFTTQWFPNEHMSRLRILRPGHSSFDLGVTWVVWPMIQATVSSTGRPPTTIQVSVQDVIGFVRSMHNKHPAVQIVVRDASGRRAVSLLPGATHVALPATGKIRLHGVSYEVRSFRRWSFAQRPLPVTVWVLLPTA